MIQILIADDHTFFRSGLRQVLEANERYVVVDEAGDGIMLVEMALRLRPQLVIADIEMPRMNGIDATQLIVKQLPQTKIIGLSMHTDEAIILKMMQAGAMGFLEKQTTKEELYNAIESVVQEQRFYFPSTTNERLLQLICHVAYKPYPKNDVVFTEREMEVIELTCKDYTHKEIAEQLSLSKRTVETHRMRIMEKMQVKSVAGLVAYAYTNGLISFKNSV